MKVIYEGAERNEEAETSGRKDLHGCKLNVTVPWQDPWLALLGAVGLRDQKLILSQDVSRGELCTYGTHPHWTEVKA